MLILHIEGLHRNFSGFLSSINCFQQAIPPVLHKNPKVLCDQLIYQVYKTLVLKLLFNCFLNSLHLTLRLSLHVGHDRPRCGSRCEWLSISSNHICPQPPIYGDLLLYQPHLCKFHKASTPLEPSSVTIPELFSLALAEIVLGDLLLPL